MSKNIDIWLERLSSLYKSQMRKAVSEEGVQLVNLEILQYLSIANQYSNTAQALSEYLGQTKGSISQSLKIMEKSGHIKRMNCVNDKRVIRLFLTAKGEASLNRMSKHLISLPDEDAKNIEAIKSILQTWQAQKGQKGFAQCLSCAYHQKISGQQFQCGLTKAFLPNTEAIKICREHDFAPNIKH